MKMFDKIESCGGEYRADILGDTVMHLHVSGILTDSEANRAHARINKKVAAELVAMPQGKRIEFIRQYHESRRAKNFKTPSSVLG